MNDHNTESVESTSHEEANHAILQACISLFLDSKSEEREHIFSFAQAREDVNKGIDGHSYHKESAENRENIGGDLGAVVKSEVEHVDHLEDAELQISEHQESEVSLH